MYVYVCIHTQTHTHTHICVIFGISSSYFMAPSHASGTTPSVIAHPAATMTTQQPFEPFPLSPARTRAARAPCALWQGWCFPCSAGSCRRLSAAGRPPPAPPPGAAPWLALRRTAEPPQNPPVAETENARASARRGHGGGGGGRRGSARPPARPRTNTRGSACARQHMQPAPVRCASLRPRLALAQKAVPRPPLALEASRIRQCPSAISPCSVHMYDDLSAALLCTYVYTPRQRGHLALAHPSPWRRHPGPVGEDNLATPRCSRRNLATPLLQPPRHGGQRVLLGPTKAWRGVGASMHGSQRRQMEERELAALASAENPYRIKQQSLVVTRGKNVQQLAWKNTGVVADPHVFKLRHVYLLRGFISVRHEFQDCRLQIHRFYRKVARAL
jgi:hypothetical protein